MDKKKHKRVSVFAEANAALDAILKKHGILQNREWDESAHPRVPAGSDGGGRFTSKMSAMEYIKKHGLGRSEYEYENVGKPPYNPDHDKMNYLTDAAKLIGGGVDEEDIESGMVASVMSVYAHKNGLSHDETVKAFNGRDFSSWEELYSFAGLRFGK